MITRVSRHRAGEGGFTLIELLVTVAMMGIVAVALGAAFYVSLHDTKGLNQRYSESHDAQIASAYLANDVQSSANLTASVCGSGGSALVNFQYADGTLVTYAYGPNGSETQLRRRTCGSSGTDVVLVHNGGGTPTVTCDGVACNPATAPRPFVVKITVPELNASTGTNDYTYSLSGSRRTYQAGATPPNPAPYGVLAIGGATNSLKISGGALNVNGPIIVDPPSGCTTSCVAASLSGSGTLTSTGLFQIVTPGTCSGCSGRATPMPTSRPQPPVPDPFAYLQSCCLPNESNLTLHSETTISGTIQQGVYRNAVSTSGPTTFSPGIYVFNGGLTIKDVVDATAGVLIFNGCGLNHPGSCPNGQLKMSAGGAFTGSPLHSQTYGDLLLWQPSTNSQSISFLAGSVATSLQGIIYAPGSTSLTVGSGSSVMTVFSIVGTNITITQGTVNVTPS